MSRRLGRIIRCRLDVGWEGQRGRSVGSRAGLGVWIWLRVAESVKGGGRGTGWAGLVGNHVRSVRIAWGLRREFLSLLDGYCLLE